MLELQFGAKLQPRISGRHPSAKLRKSQTRSKIARRHVPIACVNIRSFIDWNNCFITVRHKKLYESTRGI